MTSETEIAALRSEIDRLKAQVETLRAALVDCSRVGLNASILALSAGDPDLAERRQRVADAIDKLVDELARRLNDDVFTKETWPG